MSTNLSELFNDTLQAIMRAEANRNTRLRQALESLSQGDEGLRQEAWELYDSKVKFVRKLVRKFLNDEPNESEGGIQLEVYITLLVALLLIASALIKRSLKGARPHSQQTERGASPTRATEASASRGDPETHLGKSTASAYIVVVFSADGSESLASDISQAQLLSPENASKLWNMQRWVLTTSNRNQVEKLHRSTGTDTPEPFDVYIVAFRGTHAQPGFAEGVSGLARKDAYKALAESQAQVEFVSARLNKSAIEGYGFHL
jgi:hypothetical protein